MSIFKFRIQSIKVLVHILKVFETIMKQLNVRKSVNVLVKVIQIELSYNMQMNTIYIVVCQQKELTRHLEYTINYKKPKGML